MLKFLRNFVARDVHSHFDIAVYFIAVLVTRSFLDNGGGHFYALLIMWGIIFAGIYLQGLLTAFVNARLKAKAEKALYLEQKEKTNQYNGRDGNGYQPVGHNPMPPEGIKRPDPPPSPPARSVTGKPPRGK